MWLLPTGPGEPRELGVPSLEAIEGGGWLPDGKSVVLSAREKGKEVRLYLQALDRSPPRPISSEGVTLRDFGNSVSPDGRFVLGLPSAGQLSQHPEQRGNPYLYDLEGGEPRAIPGLEAGELPIQWSADGRSVYVYRRAISPARVWLLDIEDGKRRLWKEISPRGQGVRRLLVTPDGRSYAYNSSRSQSSYRLPG